jgi:uncharacterized membrane protein HdeD (DUF308 family)
MFELLTRNWWAVALRGLSVLLFGLATIAWPDATITTLVLFFGIFAIMDGLLALAALFDRALAERRWALALQGALSILAGALAFVRPDMTALAFIYLISAWAIVIGGLTVVAAIELRQQIEDEWLLGLSGGAAALFGVGLALYPDAGMIVLLSIIASYAIIAGLLQIVLGLRLRRQRAMRERTVAPT